MNSPLICLFHFKLSVSIFHIFCTCNHKKVVLHFTSILETVKQGSELKKTMPKLPIEPFVNVFYSCWVTHKHYRCSRGGKMIISYKETKWILRTYVFHIVQIYWQIFFRKHADATECAIKILSRYQFQKYDNGIRY